MSIPSPLEKFEINRELVCEFFATFSRLAFSLKELGYSRNEHGVISPLWWRFSEEVAPTARIELNSDLEQVKFRSELIQIRV